MIIANNANGERISAREAIVGEQYFCPTCNAPVILKAKNSKYVSPYFAHQKNRICTDTWKYEMSEWHREWQNLFPKECQEIVMEKDGVKHRADVRVGKTVIEFQHSPISSSEFAERNRFYTSCGYAVVWVFDAEGKIKNQNHTNPTFLDPVLSKPGDFCWLRKKETFIQPLVQNDILIYLHYKTICSPENSSIESRPVDILLPLKTTDPKEILYHPFKFRIFIPNFLKEYNVTHLNSISLNHVKSVTQLYYEECAPSIVPAKQRRIYLQFPRPSGRKRRRL